MGSLEEWPPPLSSERGHRNRLTDCAGFYLFLFPGGLWTVSK